MAGPPIKVRENPVKKRERTGRVSREMSMTLVKLSPDDRRGVTFGRIVAAGIKALRPDIQEDVSQTVLDTVAETVITTAAELLDAMENGVLRERVAELERQIADAQAKIGEPETRFSARDIANMRTLREYGSYSYAQLARHYGATVDEIKAALLGKWRREARALPPGPKVRVRIPHAQPEAEPEPTTTIPHAAE